jgi:hypothetical protein
MMKGKLTSQELSDIMLQSVALSTILAEKFEIMTENNLVIHKAKQSLKTTTGFLNNYVDKVFQVDDAESEEGQHMKTGASYIAELTNRIETSLTTENLLSISDRKTLLLKIVDSTLLEATDKHLLYEQIRDSGIIDY